MKTKIKTIKKDPGVKVGLAAIIVKNGKILLGERGEDVETFKNHYAFPGGRMDYGEESPRVGLAREVFEETNLEVNPNDFIFIREVSEFFPEEKKHYITLVYLTFYFEGKLLNKEGEGKCKGWKWVSPDKLPKNISPYVWDSIQVAMSYITNNNKK